MAGGQLRVASTNDASAAVGSTALSVCSWSSIQSHEESISLGGRGDVGEDADRLGETFERRTYPAISIRCKFVKTPWYAQRSRNVLESRIQIYNSCILEYAIGVKISIPQAPCRDSQMICAEVTIDGH
jgi:hypothetical protein